MNIDTKYIITFLEGKLPAEEQKLFEEQIEASSELQKEVDDITFIWKTSSELKLHTKADTEKNWKIVSNRIRKDRYKARFLNFTRNAAAILLLPILLLTGFWYFKSNEDIPVQQIEVSSAYGLITRTTLPDGTEVWLNSGSKLIYPQKFTSNKRVVHLLGEAYFKVSSDKANRFDVVMFNDLVVSAYGTEFNINAYHEDKGIDVTLVKGNIEVKNMDSPTAKDVIPGQHLSYMKEDRSMKVEEANLAVKTGWVEGKMIFRRASMTEVVQRLSRHFNVDIRLEGKELYGYEYSATFTTETLSEILRLLEKTAPIEYKMIEPEQSGDNSFSKRVVIISMKN